MSNDAAWKHLTLSQAVTLSSNKSNFYNNEHIQNGQPSPPHYVYDYDQLNLNTPSAASNNNPIRMVSYDSMSMTATMLSNIHTPTTSRHTPVHSQSNRSQTENLPNLCLQNLNFAPYSHSPSHSVSESITITNNPNLCSQSSKSLKKKRAKSPGHKFAVDFFKKAKVKQVMRGSTIIGQIEAKLMLAYFRNVEVDHIDSTDMALRYLESKSIRKLKRTLREINETIRRTFLYGSDFSYVHEQHLLGNDLDDITDNNETLTPITEHIASKAANVVLDEIDIMIPAGANVVHLGDLANDDFSTLDDYLQSPNTTYTYCAKFSDLATPKNDDVFDPLRGAQNVNIKPNTPLNFKRNYGKKLLVKKLSSAESNEFPNTLPHIDEHLSFSNDKTCTPAPQLIKRVSTSNTKMFGKYFDKRGSNISHNSIWSESEDDGTTTDGSEEPYILTQFSIDDDSASQSQSHTYTSTNTSHSDIHYHNKPPAKAGKEHISQFSFASTVSLGSDYTSANEDMEEGRDEVENILIIEEDTEIGHLDENEIDRLVNTTSLKANSLKHSNSNLNKKGLKKRKYSKGKEVKDPNVSVDTYLPDNETQKQLKLLKIDSLLLDPHNQPSVKHEANYSLDSFLSDMDMPSPTDVEKLKYHLTEPRLAPSRRKTFN